ncbi:MAG: L-threonylcarbamoyladenylate synthase [Eubacteriales bacterium]|nr:L-threonylcarbamoyladenylate synthase [Eubacteriales bacterium]
METKIFRLNEYINSGSLSEEDIEKLKQAGEILKKGGLVAFPTETVYGLGGNALLKDASKDIYAAKGRPSDNPLIVHISDMDELPQLVESVPEMAVKLAVKFWPGPLTMVMKKSDIVPYETTGGLDTVAIRMPEHKVANMLIKLSEVPVAAPSANISGRPSPTSAEHCIEDLSGRIEAIVDGGASAIGVESTIVDLSGEVPVLLRPGAITVEMLKECLQREVMLDPALEKPLDKNIRPKAPGMKYRHYAPKAPMIIIQSEYSSGDSETDNMSEADKKFEFDEGLKKITECAIRNIEEKCAEGLKLGIICSDETMDIYMHEINDQSGKLHSYRDKLEIMSAGQRANEITIAHNLFAVLREMDERAVDFIVAEGFSQKKLGYAIMNRMKKAAGQHVINV